MKVSELKQIADRMLAKGDDFEVAIQTKVIFSSGGMYTSEDIVNANVNLGEGKLIFQTVRDLEIIREYGER